MLPAEHAEADAQRIREAAERCGRIVRTFLNMARQRPGERAPVQLNDLVRAAAEVLGYTLRSHGIRLVLALDEQLPTVHADGDQLGQIVLNLPINAQQALGAAAADTTKGEGLGTGLVLSVSRGIVRSHGGDLFVEDAVEGGTVFRLWLPPGGAVSPAETQLPAAVPPPRAAASVVVVDDEPEIADLVSAMLQGAGFETDVAEARQFLQTARCAALDTPFGKTELLAAVQRLLKR